MCSRIALLVVVLIFACETTQAFAQARAPVRRAAPSTRSGRFINRPKLGYNPAAQIYRSATLNRPTVSPYLNLLRPQGLNQVPNYQSLVRPQVQQERTNQQQAAALQRLDQTIGSLESRGEGTTGIRPTGHHTTFLGHGGYFNTYP
jgi:hypothetical protein